MPELFTHGYALLIGVGQTEYPKWSLPVTASDAQAMHRLLSDPARGAYPAEQIRLLYDEGATRQAILSGLDWLAGAVAKDTDATAIVFFSGHGWQDTANNAYYLIPYDTDPVDVTGSAIDGQDFTDKLRIISARRLLVILDCCHAGGIASAKDGQATMKLPPGMTQVAAPKTLVADLKRGAGRAVFSSSTDAQRSWVRPDNTLSLYTRHLIEALEGAAGQPGDTTVRLLSVADYVSRTVAAAAEALGQQQTPFFDTATEDFPIALLLGGKGLGPGGYRSGATADPRGLNVAGDYVAGDKVMGDKVVINNNAPNQGAQGTFQGPVNFTFYGTPSGGSTPRALSPAEQRQADIDTQRERLRAERQRLQTLLFQLAQLGSAWAPPGVQGGINDARREIRRIKATLQGWNQEVDNHPDDEG